MAAIPPTPEGGGLPCRKPVIEVTVLAVHNGVVRLGFKAPDGIRIDRKEVVEERSRNREQ